MQIAPVSGSIMITIKAESIHGQKLLNVRKANMNEKVTTDSLVKTVSENKYSEGYWGKGI